MNSIKKNNLSIFSYMLLGFCVAILIYAFSLGINGNDFWWHIKVGEWIMSHHSVPTRDIFSWYATKINATWVSHEWLSEVILYGIMNFAGVVGIFVFSLIMALVLFVIFVKAAGKDIEKNYILSAIYLLLFVCLLYIYCYGRPQIFTYLLLNAELAILYAFKKNPESKLIYLIPLIGCMWSNIHGGSSNLTYILTIMLFVSGCLNFSYGKIKFIRMPKKALIKLGLTTLVSILAICINPHGVQMLIYPFANMGDTLMLKLITEWASPDAKDLAQLIFFFIPVIGVVINFFATDKDIDSFDFFNFGFFTYMFLRSTRFIMFFIIASAFYAFKYLIDGKKKPTYQGTASEKMVVCLLFGICLLFSAFGIYNSTVTYKSDRGLIKEVLDKDFIELVKEENPERLFSDYNYGETLIYYDIPVFVDSRADVYSGEILEDYASLSFMSLQNEDDYDVTNYVDEIIEKYNFDAFLIETDSALLPYLYSHSESYELVKISEDTAYFRTIQ